MIFLSFSKFSECSTLVLHQNLDQRSDKFHICLISQDTASSLFSVAQRLCLPPGHWLLSDSPVPALGVPATTAMTQSDTDVSSCPDNKSKLPEAADEVSQFPATRNTRTSLRPTSLKEKQGWRQQACSFYPSPSGLPPRNMLPLQRRGIQTQKAGGRAPQRAFRLHFGSMHMILKSPLPPPDENLSNVII